MQEPETLRAAGEPAIAAAKYSQPRTDNTLDDATSEGAPTSGRKSRAKPRGKNNIVDPDSQDPATPRAAREPPSPTQARLPPLAENLIDDAPPSGRNYSRPAGSGAGRQSVPVSTAAAFRPKPRGKNYVVDPSRDSLLRAIGAAWEISQKFDCEFDFTTVITLGEQSAGKTTFVERCLGIAFAVVASNLATKRPTDLLVLPGEDLDIAVHATNRGQQEHAASFRTLEDLSVWMKANNTLSEEPLSICIRSASVRCPKRIVDLPGLRTNDTKDTKGTKETIMNIVRREIQKPNTIVLCLQGASTHQQASTSELVRLLTQELMSVKGFQERMIPILTKSDALFSEVHNEQKFAEHITEYESHFKAKPFLCGSSLPSNIDESNRNERHNAYLSANSREERAKSELQARVPKLAQNDWAKYFNTHVGFQKVEDIITERILKLDTPKLAQVQEFVQREMDECNATLERVRAGIKTSDATTYRHRVRSFVQATANDMMQFATQKHGFGAQVFLSDAESLSTYGLTLEDEEDLFMKRVAEGAYDVTQNYGSGSAIIDYCRSGQYQVNEFSEFYDNFRGAVMPSLNIPKKDVALLAGPALHRASREFTSMTLAFVVPCANDRAVLHNALGSDPEMVNYENRLLRVKRLGDIHANKLRPAAKYFVQRTCFLLEQCLCESFELQRMCDDHNALIEELGGEHTVLPILQRGFNQELTRHARHAYSQICGDHTVLLHQLGAFQSHAAMLSALGLATQQDAKALEATSNSLLDALRRAVKQSLPSGFDTTYPAVHAGMEEALDMVSHAANHAALPHTIRLFVNAMVDRGLLTDADKVPVDSTSSVCNILASFDEHRNMAHLLGFAVVLFAHCSPQFVNSVLARCMSGLWCSPDVSPYQADYQISMERELLQECGSQDFLDERVRQLQDLERTVLDRQDLLRRSLRDLGAASRRAY